MANEIGYWNSGSGGSTKSLFQNTSYGSINAADTYTASSGDTITAVRCFRSGTGTERTASIGLYTVSGGLPNTLVAETPVTILAAGGVCEVTGLSWALTGGTTYCLAIGEVSAGFVLTALAEASSTAQDDTADNNFPATWANNSTTAVRMELAGDVTSGGSTTITPTTGSVTVNGRAASMNPFTTVTILEVLINEAGAPVTNRTGMHLMVWYAGVPGGAPDLSYSALTTDTNGTASWSLATGGLAYNQTIFYLAHDGGSSLSMYTCARMIPIYA